MSVYFYIDYVLPLFSLYCHLLDFKLNGSVEHRLQPKPSVVSCWFINVGWILTSQDMQYKHIGLCFDICLSFCSSEELQEAKRLREEAESSGSPPPATPRAQIPFSACMNAFSEPETLTDFWSSAVQGKTTATKWLTFFPLAFLFLDRIYITGEHRPVAEVLLSFLGFRTTRFASFPDYLVIQIKKFTFGLDWVPKKLGKYSVSFLWLKWHCLCDFSWLFEQSYRHMGQGQLSD